MHNLMQRGGANIIQAALMVPEQAVVNAQHMLAARALERMASQFLRLLQQTFNFFLGHGGSVADECHHFHCGFPNLCLYGLTSSYAATQTSETLKSTKFQGCTLFPI